MIESYEECCGNCQFWYGNHTEYAERSKLIIKNNMETGSCARFPPKSFDQYEVALHPITLSVDFCGEWKWRDPKEDYGGGIRGTQ